MGVPPLHHPVVMDDYDLVFFQAMVTTQFLSPQCFRNPQKTLGDWRAAGALVQVDITLLASASQAASTVKNRF